MMFFFTGTNGAVEQTLEDIVTPMFASSEQGFWYDPSDTDTIWQDSGATTSASTLNDPIQRLDDLSGNSNNATNTGGTLRPLHKQKNGYSYIEFDGSNDVLKLSTTAVNEAENTFVGVFSVRQITTFIQFFGADASLAAGLHLINVGGGQMRFITYNATDGQIILDNGADVVVDEVFVVSLEFDIGLMRTRLNGTIVAENTTPTTNFSTEATYKIGDSAGVYDTYLDFYGAVNLDRLMTTDERESLIEFYCNKYCQKAGVTLGDSTITAHSGSDSVIDRMSLTEITSKYDLAVAGNTIAGQKTRWETLRGVKGKYEWVIIQVGINDCNPADGTTAGKIAALQDLVDTIKGDVASFTKVIISKMTPCKSYLDTAYGAGAQTRWEAINEAIAGDGASPITNVDGRVTAHVPLMADVDGNLAVEYRIDTVHPNNAGRDINAAAWEAVITSIGAPL